MSHYVLNNRTYTSFHQNQDVKFRENMLKSNGRRRYSGNTVTQLLDRSSVDLYAINCRSRVAFARSVCDLACDLKSEEPGETYWFLTLAPEEFAVPLSSSAPRYVRSLRTWTEEILEGLDYIGFIEAGFYNRGIGQSGSVEPIISWHAHALAWGCDDHRISTIVRGVNDECFSLIPRIKPGHARRLREDQVEGHTWYMLKAPWIRYSVFPRKRTVPDPETAVPRYQNTGRFKQKSGSLIRRPGEAAKIAAAMTGLRLPDLAVAGGAGRHVFRKAEARAVRRIARHDLCRRQELERLLAIP